MRKDIGISLAWAGGMIGLALMAGWARRQGYIGEDVEVRAVAMNGLVIAYYGNLAPKALAPTACARQATRFGGWAMVLSGLLYAGLWAMAPLSIASTIGTGAVAVGVAATLAYCYWLRRPAHAGMKREA